MSYSSFFPSCYTIITFYYLIMTFLSSFEPQHHSERFRIWEGAAHYYFLYRKGWYDFNLNIHMTEIKNIRKE